MVKIYKKRERKMVTSCFKFNRKWIELPFADVLHFNINIQSRADAFVFKVSYYLKKCGGILHIVIQHDIKVGLLSSGVKKSVIVIYHLERC